MSDSRTDEFDDDDVDLEEEFPEDVEDYEPEPNVVDEDDLEIDEDYDATDEDEEFPDDERPVVFDAEDELEEDDEFDDYDQDE